MAQLDEVKRGLDLSEEELERKEEQGEAVSERYIIMQNAIFE